MAGVDSAAPLEDVDLQTTEEIDAKRGTLDPLDEAALQAARPATIEIPVTHVFAKDKVAMYYVKCTTSDGRVWAVARRYSQFKSFKDRLIKSAPSVAKLAFPKKTWSSGVDEATIATRTEALLQWMNELVIMLPEDVGLEREVCMFLAEDDSLVDLDEDPAVRDKVFGALGIQAARRGVDPPLSPASEMQRAMTAGKLSFADVTSPRKSEMGGEALPPTSAWPEGAEWTPGMAVKVEVIGSEEGRVCPITNTWQLNEGKGSRHVRYVLQVSAHGRTIIVRRRWRQMVAFSDQLQRLSQGWLKPGDQWHESNKLKSGWRNPGFNEKKIAERREVLSRFFTAFSFWATRLASTETPEGGKRDQIVDFFDPNVHPRLQSIKEFLVGPDSLENDPPTRDSGAEDRSPHSDSGTADGTAGEQAIHQVDASVEVGDWPPAESTDVARRDSAAELGVVQEETVEDTGTGKGPGEGESMAKPEPQLAPVTDRAPASDLDVTVELDNVRSC